MEYSIRKRIIESKHFRFICKTLLFLIICFTPLDGFTNSATKTENLNKYLKLCEKYYTFTGSVLIASNGSILYKKGIGSRVFPKIKNTPETKFMIGSVSKPFTAILTLQLVEEGKLKLNGKVSDYLEYYPKENGEKITIHQ